MMSQIVKASQTAISETGTILRRGLQYYLWGKGLMPRPGTDNWKFQRHCNHLIKNYGWKKCTEKNTTYFKI